MIVPRPPNDLRSRRSRASSGRRWSALGRRRRDISAVALSALIMLVILPPLARASASWSPPMSVDSSSLLSVSCPSTSFCAAVDSAGSVLTFNGVAWSAPQDIDARVPLMSVSCPSASFCAAVDSAGSVLTFNGVAWGTPKNIDGANTLSSVSCASALFCVAVDWAGKAVTFNGAAWSTPENIDGANTLSSVSCASALFCVAVDKSGNEVTYTGAWAAPVGVDPARSPSSVSCPSAVFCLAVDIDSHFVTYEGSSWSAPTGLVVGGLSSVSCASALFCVAVNDGNGYAMTYDGSAWDPGVSSIDRRAGLRSVSCPSATFCAAVDNAGNALIYSTPPPAPVSASPPVISGSAVEGALLTAAHGSWANAPTSFSYRWEECNAFGAACSSAIPDATAQAYLISAKDVGHTIRVEEVASNASGSNSAISTATAVVVLPAEIALSNVLVPVGNGAKLKALLRRRGYSTVFDAPSAGRLAISWYSELRKAKGRQLVLIAKLSVSIQHAGAKVVSVTLTRRGRQLLAHSRRLTVISKGTFTPSGQPATSVTKRFTLRR